MGAIFRRWEAEPALGRAVLALSIVATLAAVASPALANIRIRASANAASRPLLRPYAKLAGGPARAIALSSDGSTALIGEEGSATVYARSGNSWVPQTRLEPGGESGADAFGCSVALSADGDTALIGAPGRSAGSSVTAAPSAAWVFARSGGSWVQEAVLEPPAETGAAAPLGCGANSYGAGEGSGGGYGSSVALSGDGSAALVAAPGADRYTGEVWAYKRSASTWAPAGPRLLAPEAGVGALFGASIAFSADGDTALIGAPDDIPPRCRRTGTYAGGVWTYTRTAGTWTQSGERVAPDGACAGSFGGSIALSSDADTALVSDAGRVLPFARSGSSWSRQGPPLSCLQADCGALYDFSLSLSLSGDGNVALVGATPETDCGKYMYALCFSHGLALTFDRFGATWVQRRARLEGPTSFGSAVALSGSGESALIGESGGPDAYLLPPPPPNSFSAGELVAERSGALDQQIASSAAGAFTASATVSARELGLARGSHGALIGYGRGTALLARGGIVTVKIEPTSRVRRALSKHRSILPKLHLTIGFEPRTGATPTPQTFTVYRR